jgi:hypothetical protein
VDPDITNVLRIDGRYNGPPDSGNGGVTCGLLAIHVDAPVVQVTLRTPPPLDTDLLVRGAGLYDGDTLVAEAEPGTITVSAPPSVGLERAAASVFAGLTSHPFPTCFVCGPDHPDGLHLFAGPVGEGLVATTWTPDDAGDVLVWAALDCPGGWSADLPGRPMVLGRMTCRIDASPVAGQTYVVQGWLRGGEGRKVLTGSALYDAAGAVLAVAEATWITLT